MAAVSLQVVPFLNGVSIVSSCSRYLLFRHYSYSHTQQDGHKWNLSNETKYQTDFTHVVKFSLHNISEKGVKVPCTLCRQNQDKGSYCIIQYDPTSSVGCCRVGCRLSSSNGLPVVMINADTLVCLGDSVNATPPIDHIWQFNQPCSSNQLIAIKLGNELNYLEVSKVGVIKVPAPIPCEYAPFVTYMSVYWKPVISGRGLLQYTPLLMVITSFNQLLIFERTTTLLCLQLDDKVSEDITVIQEVYGVFLIALRIPSDSSTVIYRVTEQAENDSVYGLGAVEVLRKKDSGRGHGGTVAMVTGNYSESSNGEQLLVIGGSANINDEPIFEIIDNFTDQSSLVVNEGVPGNQSLINAARSLENRKLSDDAAIKEKQAELVRKVDLVVQAMNGLCGINQYPSNDKSLIGLLEGEGPCTDVPSCDNGELKLLRYWQRIVDERFLAVGLLLWNDTINSITDISIQLVPNQVGVSFSTKMVSLVSLEGPSLFSSRSIPAHSRSCFIVSSDISNGEISLTDHMDVVVLYQVKGVAHQVQGVANQVEGVTQQVKSMGHQVEGVAHKLEGVAHQLQAELPPNNWTDCIPLKELYTTWTLIKDDVYTSEHLLKISDQPSDEEMDLACHFGSKQLSIIKMKNRQYCDGRGYIDHLPFHAMGVKATPTLCLLSGVCLLHTQQEGMLVIHRTLEELGTVKKWLSTKGYI